MADTYITISHDAKATLTEKRSRFLAFVHAACSVEDAKEIISRYRKEYYDARHVCWAYMLGFDRSQSQSSDDGEPSGTAGRPILGQINSLGLTDVVVIVVRYFGGIKLGTPGLIAAYREAARMALDDAGAEERIVMQRISFTFPYLAMNDVMKIVKRPGVEVVKQHFDNACTMTIAVRADDAPELTARLEGHVSVDDSTE